MLEAMRHDHCHIQSLARDLETKLAVAGPRDLTAIVKLRWNLLRELLRHAASERVFIEEAAPAIAARSDLHTDFARSLRAHVADWSMRSPAKEWDAFKSSLRGFLQAVHAQIAFEEARIYPALADCGAPGIGNARPAPNPASPALKGRF